MDALFGRLACCGPSGAERYVYESDEGSSDGDFADATVARRDSGDGMTELPPDQLDPGSLRVIPSSSRPAERRRHQKSSSMALFVQQREAKEQLEQQQRDGSRGEAGASSLSARWAAFSLVRVRTSERLRVRHSTAVDRLSLCRLFMVQLQRKVQREKNGAVFGSPTPRESRSRNSSLIKNVRV